jgi:AGCS family alanine or glycine:cation symporter
MNELFAIVDAINGVMLSVPMLLGLLATGLLFTLWSGFCQYRSWTHGVMLVAGKGIDTSKGPGALSHFQALTAALSGTVGLGAIAGMAIAVEFGGPGAVFWMWVVGLVGMALKSTEVTLALLYRDVSDPENPHGGTMYVLRDGLGKLRPGWQKFGTVVGGLFALSLMLFAVTGGNMFQAWNVADTTREYFGVPTWVSGLILATVVGAVLLGGIKRIGNVTKTLVPFKCGVYVLVGLYVLVLHAEELPDLVRLIFVSAFSRTEAAGAFTGAVMGSAFMFGMKRALFSSESGLGTAPIAHSAVKTPEPVTEGVVAGLEPFIDTIFVCTVTGLVILCTGVWNRGAAGQWAETPAIVQTSAGDWQPDVAEPPAGNWKVGDSVFVVVQPETAATAGDDRRRIYGTITRTDAGQGIAWSSISADSELRIVEPGLFQNYRGSTLVAKSFDTVHEGLGRWLITVAVWVFAVSTLITYGYYGEQGVIYLGGERYVMLYRWIWCIVAGGTCLGFIKTAEQIDSLSTVAMGFMYAINLPTMIVLGRRAMAAYHSYFRRLKAGEIAR